MAKKPTGLSMARNENKITCKWKRGEKYNKGQQFGTRVNKESYSSSNLGSTVTSKAITFSLSNYYPTTTKTVNSISFRVRGKKGGSWSSYEAYTLTLEKPKKPEVTVTPDNGINNRCVFAWETATSKTDVYIFVDVEWQSMLVEDSNTTDGSLLSWDNTGSNDWQTGTGTATSSTTIDETINISTGTHTRWFRARSRGPKGASDWVYGRRVYAAPYQPIIEEANVTKTTTGYQAYVKWSNMSNVAYPTDTLTVDYTMATPDAGLVCPSGATPTTAATIAQRGDTNAVSFSIDTSIGLDKVLYARVNSVHLDKTTNGDWTLVQVGNLTAPTLTSVTQDPGTFKATINATNNSAVTDSFIAILYRTALQPDDFAVLGVIPAGSSSATVQCPDWTGETVQYGIYAVVGSATAKTRADGVGSYEITANMKSDIVWQAGSMPDAPTSVTVAATNVQGSVKVAWNWSWQDANNAVISWADHEDAWESTSEPSEYTVSNVHASEWTIAGLETGKRWYVRVRLVNGTGDTAIYGPWSNLAIIDLSSAPSIPTLTLSSGIIPVGGSVSAYWGYVSTDGTAQAYAEICEATISGGSVTYGTVIAQTETAQHITIYADDVGWNQDETHYLCVRVVSASGRKSDGWSDPVPVTIAEPLTATITQTSLVPEEVEVNPQTFAKADIVSFTTDSEMEFTELQATITPIQDLNGYEYPWVGGAGANQWNEEWESGYINSDGSMASNASSIRSKNFCACLPSTAYYFRKPSTYAQTPNICWYDASKSFISRSASTPFPIITSPSNAYYFKISCYNYGGTYSNDICINISDPSINGTYYPYSNICPITGWSAVQVTVADDPDTPVESQTYTTSLGTTVYGGTLDVVSGELTVTKVSVDMGGLTWQNYSSAPHTRFGTTGIQATVKKPSSDGVNADIISDRYVVDTSTHIYDHAKDGTIGVGANGVLYVYDTSYASPNDFKTAMNGVYLIYELANPLTYQLTPQQINTLLGNNNVWADCGQVEVTIAEAFYEQLQLTQMPLTVTVTGAGTGGTTTVAIERAEAYHVDRPDETDFNGYEGETIYVGSQTGEAQMTIDREMLIGSLDDGALYRLIATVEDGLGQSDTTELLFAVNWAHQAIEPLGTATISGTIAQITPTAPVGYQQGDTVDIYRLSADRPELIVEGGEFGTTYVDPYPAIGVYGGHRIVYKTYDGDYITANNDIAWLDLGKNNNDYLDLPYTIINFGSEEIQLKLNLDLTNTWTKSFKETKYLGGSVQGDWNKGYSRTGTVKGLVVSTDDPDTIRQLKRLAVWDGICHIRTPEGSSFACDIQVSDDISHASAGKAYTPTLNITRVEPEEPDGVALAIWNYEES